MQFLFWGKINAVADGVACVNDKFIYSANTFLFVLFLISPFVCTNCMPKMWSEFSIAHDAVLAAKFSRENKYIRLFFWANAFRESRGIVVFSDGVSEQWNCLKGPSGEILTVNEMSIDREIAKCSFPWDLLALLLQTVTQSESGAPQRAASTQWSNKKRQRTKKHLWRVESEISIQWNRRDFW